MEGKKKSSTDCIIPEEQNPMRSSMYKMRNICNEKILNSDDFGIRSHFNKPFRIHFSQKKCYQVPFIIVARVSTWWEERGGGAFLNWERTKREGLKIMVSVGLPAALSARSAYCECFVVHHTMSHFDFWRRRRWESLVDGYMKPAGSNTRIFPMGGTWKYIQQQCYKS